MRNGYSDGVRGEAILAPKEDIVGHKCRHIEPGRPKTLSGDQVVQYPTVP